MYKMKSEITGLFRTYKFKSMFFRYFSVFIILIILPAVLLGTVAYKAFYDNLNEEVGRANANTLNKTLQSIDILLSNIEKISDIYASDPYMVKYLINPDTTPLNNIGSMLNQISTISSSSYVHSVYLYNMYNNVVLSSKDGIQPFNTFYDKEWMKAFENSDSKMIWMNTRVIESSPGNANNCITLIRKLPYSTDAPNGAIIINIDEAKLSSIMDEQIQNGALIYIVNQEGNVVSHPDREMLYKKISLPEGVQKVFNSDSGYFMNRSGTGNTLYAFSTSRLMGWKYICELSAAKPLKQAENTKRLTLLVILIYVACGIVFAFFMADKFYSPIQQLMASIIKESADATVSILGKAKERLNEYAFLEDAYSYLAGLNSNLEDSLKKTIPVLADKFFKDILLGKKIIDIADMKELLQKYNMDFELKSFFVMVVKIDDSMLLNMQKSTEDLECYKQLLLKKSREIVCGKYMGYASEIEENLIAMVVNVDSMNDVGYAVETISLQLKKVVSDCEDVTITVGVGNFYSNVNDISFSCSEAIKALNNKFYYGKDIIIKYKEIESINKYDKYDDLVSEQKFINFVKTRDIKSIEGLINEMAEEIFLKRIDEQFVKQIFSKLFVSVIHNLSDENVNIRGILSDADNIFDAIQKSETLDDIKNIALSTFSRIIACTNDKNTNRHIEEIMEYIHKNYCKDISLNSVAEKVSLSPQYISKVFRDWTGRNFAEYLAMYRVKAAKEIMQKENIPLNEVIKKVGFNNMQTFMRTFKKYEGITPGQFKQKV